MSNNDLYKKGFSHGQIMGNWGLNNEHLESIINKSFNISNTSNVENDIEYIKGMREGWKHGYDIYINVTSKQDKEW